MSHPAAPTPVADGVYRLDTGLNRTNHTAVYLLVDHDELAFVDCGAANSVPGLLHALSALGKTPAQVRYILPTHVHLDHAGGAGALLAACPQAELVIHPRGRDHLVDPSRLQQGATAVYGEAGFREIYGALTPAPAARTHSADEATPLSLGQRQLHFLDTPGHANHHGCLFDAHSGSLFTGDTFGLSYREFDRADGSPYILATTTPVAFDPERWRDSLRRMMALDPARVCLTHFGALENPQTHLAQLQASLDTHVDLALRAEAEVAPAQRPDWLREQLDAQLTTQAARHSGLAPARCRQLLALDIELNAQGLEVWLRRRAKARDSAGSSPQPRH